MTEQPQGAALTAAHTEQLTIRIFIAYPEHAPRESDKHYRVFNETRERMKRLGLLKCWINNADCVGDIELHHSAVEYSLAQDVDISKFNEAYGLHITDDSEFEDYINSEGGLLPICVFHHRSHGGIHALPQPLWVVQRFLRDGVTAPARVIPEGVYRNADTSQGEAHGNAPYATHKA